MNLEQYREYGPLVIRLFLGLGFLVAGLNKILLWGGRPNEMFNSLFGAAGTAMLVLAVLVEVIGGVALIIGWHTRYAALALAALIAVAFATTFQIDTSMGVLMTLQQLMVLNMSSNTAVNWAYFAGLLSLVFGGSGEKAWQPD